MTLKRRKQAVQIQIGQRYAHLQPTSRLSEMLADLAGQAVKVSNAQRRVAQAKAKKNLPPSTPERPMVAVDQLQKEALIINQLLNEHYGIPAKISWKRDKSAIQLTPRHRLYRLDQIKPYRIDDLIQRLDDMGRHIKAMSRDNSGGNVTVSLVPTQPAWLQVSRPDPKEHPWDNRVQGLGPLTATIGDWWNGPDRIPALIEMFGKTARHNCGLFCGGQGSGKTSILRRALVSLMENNDPNRLHIYIIETKSGDSYGDLYGLPHLKTIAGDVGSAVETVRQFDHWCTPAGNPNDGVYRLLVFDEFHDAIEDEEYGETIFAAVKRIMAKGRSLGIRVWIATQIPDRASFPPRLKGLTQFMVIGRIDGDSYIRSQLHVHGANRLDKMREFLFVDCGTPTVITSHWLPDDEFAHELGRLRSGYGSVMGGYNQYMTGTASGYVGKTLAPKPVVTSTKTGYELVIEPSTRVSDHRMEKFPLGYYRTLNDDECELVREMIIDGRSVNKVCIAVFGSKDPKRLAEIKRAIAEDGQ